MRNIHIATHSGPPTASAACALWARCAWYICIWVWIGCSFLFLFALCTTLTLTLPFNFSVHIQYSTDTAATSSNTPRACRSCCHSQVLFQRRRLAFKLFGCLAAMQTSVQIIKEDTCKIIFRDWSFEKKVLLFVVQCRKPAITISCVSAIVAIRYFQHDTWKQHSQKYYR